MKAFVKKCVKDAKTRTKLFLSLGLIINVGYAVYNIFTGILYGSIWFYSVAVYYIMLCTIKFFLLLKGFSKVGDKKGSLSDMKICGILLMVLNLSIAAIIYLTILNGTAHLYKNSVIWTAVGYTLFRIAAAAIDIRNLRHRFDPTLYSAKGLSLSVALMSFFSLQTALLDRFVPSDILRGGLNILTGTAVTAAVTVISVRRVIRANRELRKTS
ncbi:MAG: hypothetical protein UIG59_03080 [Acutalibacteraceae bacterium]|nr:hypothetical protein [Acutalibacteraceae bacterium]